MCLQVLKTKIGKKPPGSHCNFKRLTFSEERRKANKTTDTVVYFFVFIEFLQYISLHLHILPTSVAFFLHVELNWNKSKGLIYFKQLIKIAK